jgi:PadR family transcriptional regulator
MTVIYVAIIHMAPADIGPDFKKGSAELLVLALVEERARHGYEIGKLIDERSNGVLKFHIASLYPMLYRLEKRGLIVGRWVEKAGQRRRRFYRISPEGRRVLASHRTRWEEFIHALTRVAGIRHA